MSIGHGTTEGRADENLALSSYKKVAEKYRGKSDAEASILKHISLGKKVKFPDGHEEEHKIVKTTPPDDHDQIKNLIAWILEQ